ncbi:MAG: CRISPR-associated endonuclease Cas1, partial [Chloroflexota bacterium]|nr:CRISPR-associated endonuclease Cas1 [Chloroflexota bacterium]
DEYGAFIGKYSKRLKVTKKGKTLTQAPLLHLETVTIANRAVSISAAAVQECAQRGIPIHFISGIGRPYASLYSAGLTGTVATRRAQLMAYHSTQAIAIVMAFGTGKLQNQSNLLKYMAKYRKNNDPKLYQELRLRATEVLDSLIELEHIQQYPEVRSGEATLDDLRAEIMGLEGIAARRYWGAVQMVLPESYGFTKRIGRGATDPINSALNYGYGILYGEMERSIVLAGLDPYAGFLHVDRPGKPSLTLDFIEEFRQPVVDRTVVGMANKKMPFDIDDRGLLTKDTRRTLADKVINRLESPARFEGKRYPLRAVIQKQARHLATYLRGERAEYVPFIMKW